MTRVVIVGGGFAGMRAMVRLSERLGDAAELVLVDRSEESLMTPLLVDVAFGGRDVASIRIPFAEAARARGRFVPGNVLGIDFNAQRVNLADGDSIEYDYLMLAMGASRDLRSVPGLAEHAHLLWSAQTALQLREALAAFEGGPVVVVDAPTQFGALQPDQPKLWSALESAATEAALRVDDELRRGGLRKTSSVTRVTPSPWIAPAAGPKGREHLARQLGDRGVNIVTGARLAAVEPGAIVLESGERIDSALTIAFPPLRGPRALADSHVVDDAGWVLVVPETMMLPRHDNVAAAGDCTALMLPKLGHLTAIQADVAIDSLSAAVLGTPRYGVHYEPEVMYLMAIEERKAQLIYSTTLYGGTDDYVLESPTVEFMRFSMNEWYSATRGELPPDLAKDTTRRFMRALQRR